MTEVRRQNERTLAIGDNLSRSCSLLLLFSSGLRTNVVVLHARLYASFARVTLETASHNMANVLVFVASAPAIGVRNTSTHHRVITRAFVPFPLLGYLRKLVIRFEFVVFLGISKVHSVRIEVRIVSVQF